MLSTFLIEDSPIIRRHLIETLEETAPVRVVGAVEEESAAMRWLQQNRCELVIVDVVLRGGTGLGVLRRIGSREEGVPRFVVLTNYATPEMRERCAELGAHRVFDKSGELEALIDYCSELARDRDDAAH